MLVDLLFGSYRQRVLSLLLLHPDSGYHVRELARVTEERDILKKAEAYFAKVRK